jgi:hypothetical protein
MFDDIKSIFSLKAPRLCFCRCALRLFFLIFHRERVSHELLSFLSRSLSLEFSFVSCVAWHSRKAHAHVKWTISKKRRWWAVHACCTLQCWAADREDLAHNPWSWLLSPDDETRHNNRRVGWVALPFNNVRFNATPSLLLLSSLLRMTFFHV